MPSPTAYEQLISELKCVHALQSALGLLSWDEQVNLPDGAAGFRARQLSALSEIVHREFTGAKLGKLIAEAGREARSMGPEAQCVVRESLREYERAARLPGCFVARRAELESQAFHAWRKAREQNDFKGFALYLRRQIELCKEEAHYVGVSPEKTYDYFLDKHDPGLTAARVEALFSEARQGLKPLVGELLSSPKKARADIFKGFPADRQEAFLREAVEAIGFDFSRGRIDRSTHPFCAGSGDDIRMTTRYAPDNPLDSLTSAIHETGHALYEQGLPSASVGTPLGEAVGMAVHESQSRIWENQVGRSRAFWRYWEPKYRQAFSSQLEGVSFDDLLFAINAVELRPIRVDSDEVTYNLHIMLRFELEKRLFAGELAVDDLPEAWSALSEEIVGLRPRNDAEGVLQDIHWSGGAFGYFPSYCIGNMIAAQLWEAAQRDMPGLEEGFERGEFRPLLDWLREKIHRWGKQFDTLELTRRATGEELSPNAMIRYLRERYAPLYA